MSYDVVVIGAGPGGYVAAIRARQAGAAKVALVEKGHAGGTCLNMGCIPSKALIAAAHRLEQIRHAADFGIDGIDPNALRLDVARLMQRKDGIVSGLRTGVGALLKGHGVEVLQGTARIPKAGAVAVNGQTLETRAIIIATGSVVRALPGVAFDGTRIVSSDHLLSFTAVPKRLAIIGGGVIGCEFATMMAAFGAAVTVIEAQPHLLPLEDAVVGQTLARFFQKRGIVVHTGVGVESVRAADDAATVTLADGTAVTADQVLVAIGRRPCTDGLGADELGLLDDKGFVVVDAQMKTQVNGIYAIGDVVGGYALAHVASAEAEVAVRNCLGQPVTMTTHAIPRPVFTLPEVCCVGATERQLREQAIAFTTGRFAYAGLSKALCDGTRDGSMAVYADASGYVLGGYVIGEQASDLAQQLALAIQHGMTAGQFAETICSHPTLSELVKEGVEDSYGHAVHKAGARR